MISKENDPLFLIINEKLFMYNPNGSLIFYSNDKICLSTIQFEGAVKKSYEFWNCLELNIKNDSNFSCTANSLTNFLRSVFFYVQYSKAFSILDQFFSQVKYILKWTTTINANCDQSIKRIHHYLTVDILKFVNYKFLNVSKSCSYWSEIETDRVHYLFYFIFDWTYILFCRWTEIFQNAEKKIFLRQNKKLNHNNFWKIIANFSWLIVIVCDENIFHASWFLATFDAAQSYTQKLFM